MSASTKIFIPAALCLAFLSGLEPVSAKVVRWDLQNVTFATEPNAPSAPGSANGYLLFDADATPDKRLIGWDIAVTPFDILPAYRFNSTVEPVNGQLHYPGDDFYCPSSFGCIDLLSRTLFEIDPVGRRAIDVWLLLESPLSDAGGRVALSGGEFDTYLSTGLNRFIVTGQLVAIPEASAVLLLVVGLMFAGMMLAPLTYIRHVPIHPVDRAR